MTEWFYRATAKKVSFEETFDLATKDGFICRSAYEEDESRADNTQYVDFGDIIHIYFTSDGVSKAIGTFEIIGPKRHPGGHLFKRKVPATVLFEVDDAFAQRLASLGEASAERYQPDPKLNKLTGWALLKRPDMRTPPFAEAPFRGRSTLVRR